MLATPATASRPSAPPIGLPTPPRRIEFQVYAALMIGGYSILRGGVGNPIGGALGLLAVAGVANILELKAISPYFVNIIIGLLLLAAVLLDRLRGGDAFE
jgi:ribose/xylose/arabinose/galactoside ABC-type transport system permease subunit